VVAGMSPAAGMAVMATGTAVTRMVVAAGIMAVTAAGGEMAPQQVSVLALDYSGERWQRLLTTVATTTAMITRLTPGHPHLRFGIGAIPWANY
jgi:hypothetical protein